MQGMMNESNTALLVLIALTAIGCPMAPRAHGAQPAPATPDPDLNNNNNNTSTNNRAL